MIDPNTNIDKTPSIFSFIYLSELADEITKAKEKGKKEIQDLIHQIEANNNTSLYNKVTTYIHTHT